MKKVFYKWLYIEQMNFQVHIHFPQTFQMYFWTISSSSGVFKMMNLNRPSEFSALNFCFDPNLCSILNWNLLKYFLEHEFSERHRTYQMVRGKHLVLIAEFAIFRKSGKTRVSEKNSQEFSLDLTLKIPILQPSLESGFY